MKSPHEIKNENNNKDNKEVEVITPEMQEQKLAPPKPIDYWLFILIGLVISLIQIYYTKRLEHAPGMWWIWRYLIIIFTVMIPAIYVSVLKRIRGYTYIVGYLLGGLIELLFGDPFIGGYNIVVTLFLFLIIYLIFWKVWRSVAKVKIT
ncbi:MAG: hypothetical protein ACTSU2_08285 [Promethearchaeota archaeon]